MISCLRGTETPEQIVIMGAHLDDIPSTGRAPGANDDGSGSAALLAAAQVNVLCLRSGYVCCVCGRVYMLCHCALPACYTLCLCAVSVCCVLCLRAVSLCAVSLRCVGVLWLCAVC